MQIQRLLYFLICLLVCSAFFNCAKRGMPTGGDLDTIPPTFIRSSPENFSTNFDKEEVRIYFDEYIKLKDAQRQIIISPPIDPRPIISPQGSPKKYVTIKLGDSLKQNTTYTINFGNSIIDNNEENPLPFFKYVFSTGSYIDSLQVSGRVKDAFEAETDEFISVLLYEIDDEYSDSLVYQTPPTYIGYTQDSTNTFQIENMKAGNYKVVALKDKNSNYLFNPSEDKIDFLEDTLSLPTNRNLAFSLFMEQKDFRVSKTKQMGANRVVYGYEGELNDSIQIEIIEPNPTQFTTTILKDFDKDSLHLWYQPVIEKDSLIVSVSQNNYRDTVITRIKELFKDSLEIKKLNSNKLGLKEDFGIYMNLPIKKVDSSKIRILNQDSAAVNFRSRMLAFENKLMLDFEKEEKQTYTIQMLPNAFTDFYDVANDTLNFRVKTPAIADLGTLTLNVSNVKTYPIIVELVDSKGVVIEKKIHEAEDGNSFYFEFIKPGKYRLRLIYDKNKNGKWDSGNYLKQTKPETLIYFPKTVDMRANWDINENFILN
ncbi:Ig-like domain-containing protein [Mesonia ostreae]|uniref:Ig-like domain-containing protein n=1 Tax=Mesonia ostreae TaxID=861110 RepID=A0ABU2KKH7_9FLAO|nr:Ig-like domain-containing protein [Mesonia ostreae]MDT0295230.1 Ig-like domain-containing protein [Mesonia ostreae]